MSTMQAQKSAIDHGAPYQAKPSGGRNGWWYVEDKTGFNCLAFSSRPGAAFTDEANARQIADAWNQEAIQ